MWRKYAIQSWYSGCAAIGTLVASNTPDGPVRLVVGSAMLAVSAHVSNDIHLVPKLAAWHVAADAAEFEE